MVAVNFALVCSLYLSALVLWDRYLRFSSCSPGGKGAGGKVEGGTASAGDGRQGVSSLHIGLQWFAVRVGQFVIRHKVTTQRAQTHRLGTLPAVLAPCCPRSLSSSLPAVLAPCRPLSLPSSLPAVVLSALCSRRSLLLAAAALTSLLLLEPPRGQHAVIALFLGLSAVMIGFAATLPDPSALTANPYWAQDHPLGRRCGTLILPFTCFCPALSWPPSCLILPWSLP